MTEENCLGLGPGRLYIAPAGVSEDEVFTPIWYAGPTKDGVTLTYGARYHEIEDYYGRIVRRIRYGERVTVKGRLAHIQPGVIGRITGSQADGRSIQLGRSSVLGRCSRIQVGLACELPGGAGEVRFCMRASATSGAVVQLSAARDSAIGFTLEGETDGAGFMGKLGFTGAR